MLLLLASHLLAAQKDSTNTAPKLQFSAYVEVYYVYDFGKPSSHQRPSFLYNHNRHNEVNLNLGFVKGTYTSEKVRANLALMAGTYAQYNLASEQGLLQHVLEATAGVKLLTQRHLWLDAGVFSSHIGFESAISKDCWTLTRSIVAENSPYYLSGAKLTYTTPNKKWLLAGLFLNGWQRIQRLPGNNSPHFGTQVFYKPSEKWQFNYSTFLGSDKPDTLQQKRYYHNGYAIWQPNGKWGLVVGLDYGMEQKAKGSTDFNYWYAPTAIVRYALHPKLATACRVEYYDDQQGVIIATGTPAGFQTAGYSCNLDYQPEDNCLLRIEARIFHSRDAIFKEGSTRTHLNYFIATSIAIRL